MKTPDDQVIEEASKLIQLIVRARQQGWCASTPRVDKEAHVILESTELNIDSVKRQMHVLVEQMEQLEVQLRQIAFEYYNT